MHFSDDAILQINDERALINSQYESILLKHANRPFKNEKAKEYFQQGFFRRLKLLNRCIKNIYDACPPEQYTRLSEDSLSNLTINLQAFIFNCFGCIDNLAWVWIYENSITEEDGTVINDARVSFYHKEVKKTLSTEFKNYLNEISPWYEYLKNYRHALAHKIPLYVPPYMLNPEEIELEKKLDVERNKLLRNHRFDEYEELSTQIENLGRSSPFMTHSYLENSKYVYFQVQIISDWKTIVLILTKFLNELNRINVNPSQ